MTGVVLCVGEPLVVLGPSTGESLETARSLSASVGGAEANVAIHLARLGMLARFAGCVGNDPFGRRIRAALAAEGVDVSALEIDATRPTGLYAKDPGPGGTLAYYYRVGSATSALDRINPTALEDVGWVHVTGIVPSLGVGCRALVESLLEGPVDVSFDVNFRPALWSHGEAAIALRELAQRSTIMFVGLDEAAALWGCADADSVRDLFPNVELVVKDAGRPATAFRASERVDVAALDVDVVEPVGAGDAFAAGYLWARCSGGDIARALRTGHAVATGALTANDDQGAPANPDILHAATTGNGWPDGRDDIE